MSFITSIGTAVPENRFRQETIAGFMTKAMKLKRDEDRKLRTIFKSSGIDWRHSVLSDYGKTEAYSFYTETFDPFPSTEARLKVYRNKAADLSIQAIADCVKHIPEFDFGSITHLIVVSCTGMYAPGLDIDLVKRLGLRENVDRLCINFMGCYAAFNAIKAAHAFCSASKDARVLIVCTEICSLHFQKEPTEDNLLANALFADGAAALLVERAPRQGRNLEPKAFYNSLAINGAEHMAWSVGNLGFEMKLSGYVPDVIKTGIKSLTAQLLLQLRKDLSDIKYFAIHPGGKRILEVVESQLTLSAAQNKHAYDVLQNYGNMSSTTVLFVLKRIVEQITDADDGEHILSFAFGPGLTLESMMLQVVKV
ncbi:type III polyketide synthase [Oscillatoria amoena NRMC-F 0135]|nr:type III polyketide synthase [Oscillatoria amoena NRMC-F 0135]